MSMCFKQDVAQFSLNIKSQNLIEQFTRLGSNIPSTESDVNTRIDNPMLAINQNIDNMEIWS